MSKRKQSILADIETARGDLVDLALSLDGEALARPTRNELWSVKDCLCHLVSSEAGLRRIADLASKGELTARPGFNLHEYNQKQVELRRERSVQELLDELAQSRVETLRFLECLPEERLDLPAALSSGLEMTVGGVLRRIEEHDRLHAEDIKLAITR